MAKKKVFVSFDYENDKHYKFLLEAWDANSNFEFNFSDKTAHEINSDNVSRIKAGLTAKINEATCVLVIIGREANKRHQDSVLIGDINWINWEINKAKELEKGLVAVKIDKSYESPLAILNSNASWAMSFTQDAVIKALFNCKE
ncbi:TIR domain-containing protein [Methanosarcina sp. WWM596]|uniref:TIR domain-containing protein n=1 Tax=Methanosarcina sp. WWM596 TaxID=1434103 RepID=UPI000615F862|nr:TIR domain-containing protein [Methanosarcina sp. WWM596]AKB19058.1 hypothetical protein MSWHS_2195 [Methanosarcina sp. WWM596]